MFLIICITFGIMLFCIIMLSAIILNYERGMDEYRHRIRLLETEKNINEMLDRFDR